MNVRNDLFFIIPFPRFISERNAHYDQHRMDKELRKLKAEYQFRAMYRTEQGCEGGETEMYRLMPALAGIERKEQSCHWYRE
nr:hypothetical protein [uncultured Prevotella sp.]